jgi:tetratricopeptide (TPR) repeat protein
MKPTRHGYSTFLLIAFPLAFVGCAEKTQSFSALVAAERAYEARDYEAAVRQSTQYAADAPDAASRARAMFVRGISNAKAGRRAQGYADLNEAERIATDRDLQWRIFSAQAIMSFEDRNWSVAARKYEAALQTMPERPPRDTQLFRLGQCYERTSRWSDAQNCYRRLLNEFPQSKHRDEAARRVAANARFFSVQCGAFGQRSNAERLAADLRSKGFDTFVQTESSGGRALHVVLAGRFQQHEQAEQTLARVKGYVSNAILWP